MPGVRSVAFGAWVRAASLHERRERWACRISSSTWCSRGRERRSASEIALSLESLGGSLDAYTSREHTSYPGARARRAPAQAADVIGDLVFRPALRESDLALERNVVLEEIAMVEDTPDDLVFELHNEAMWGNHPYGYAILGTRETVGAMPAEAMRALHGAAYRPQHMVVAAAGRVQHDELLEILSRTGWDIVPGGEPHGPVVPEPVRGAAEPATT